MIFAVLFVIAFIIGLVCYLVSDRWWLGGVIGSLLLLVISLFGLSATGARAMTMYFGIPIIFLGSLFGAYIVQLRRAPELDESLLEDQDHVNQQDAAGDTLK